MVVIKDKIKAFFDKKAIGRNERIASNAIVEYEQKVRSSKVISLLDPQPNELILDVGCGNGRDLLQLGKRRCRCVGIDLSTKMINEARKALLEKGIKDFKLETGDATDLKYQNEMFDKVFASEVIEHIPTFQKAISEMTRVLKYGGYLVITTPNRESWYGFDRYVIYETIQRKRWKDKHPYDSWKTFNELKSALNYSGLQIKKIMGICYIPGFFISYRLPRPLKKILVNLIKNLEPLLSQLFPKNGYMIAIKAVKVKK